MTDSDPQRADPRLLASYEVTRILSAASSFENLATGLLRAVATNLGWSAGLFWRVEKDSGLMRVHAHWHAAETSFDPLVERSRKRSVTRGEGVVGQVWQTGEPVWTVDPEELGTAAVGVNSALLFPVFCDERTQAVMEFFVPGAQAPDADLLRTMKIVGFQIGQFLERERSQFEVKVAQRSAALLADAVPQLGWTRRPSGELEYVNQRWFEYSGLSREELFGGGFDQVVHPDDQHNVVETRGRALTRGESVQLELRLRRGVDGVYRWHLLRLIPQHDDTGKIVKWIGSATDIDDQRRREETEHFLSEATKLLAGALDYQTTLRALTSLAVPTLADLCSVYLREEGDSSPRRLRLVHADPSKAETARRISERSTSRQNPQWGPAEVIREGKPRLFSEVPTRCWSAWLRTRTSCGRSGR